MRTRTLAMCNRPACHGNQRRPCRGSGRDISLNRLPNEEQLAAAKGSNVVNPFQQNGVLEPCTDRPSVVMNAISQLISGKVRLVHLRSPCFVYGVNESNTIHAIYVSCNPLFESYTIHLNRITFTSDSGSCSGSSSKNASRIWSSRSAEGFRCLKSPKQRELAESRCPGCSITEQLFVPTPLSGCALTLGVESRTWSSTYPTSQLRKQRRAKYC